MTGRSRLRLLVGAVVSWGVLTGCHRGTGEPAEIRIGLLVDIPSVIANDTIAGAWLAQEAAGAREQIHAGKRPRVVTVVVKDTGNTPEGATRATLELINQEGVVAIVGSSFSRNAIPSGEVADRAGIPMVCPASTHPGTTAGKSHVFRVAFVDSVQGGVMARFAREELGLSRTAVLFEITDTYSRNMAEVFRRVFEEAGGEVAAFESVETGDRDFTRQLERIRGAAPEGIFLPNFSGAVVAQSREIRRLGIEAVLLGTDSWQSSPLLTGQEALEGAFLSQNWHPGLERSESEEFVRRFRRTFSREPGEQAALTYDAFGLIFAALATAPEIDPEAAREALSRTESYPGVTGSITYRGQGGDPSKDVVILRHEGREIRYYKSVPGTPPL